MPRLDGSGPQGQGPLTGRGDGYCAVADPAGRRPYGVAGVGQRPFGGFLGRLVGWVPRLGPGRRGRGMGRGGGRGRGRW